MKRNVSPRFAQMSLLHIAWFTVCLLANSLSSSQEERYANWDRFFYNVQLPLKVIMPTGKVKLLVYHTYPTPLHDVRIIVHSNFFVASVEPPIFKELEPTLIKDYTINLRLKDKTDAQKDKDSLTVEFRAKEMPKPKSVTLPVPLTQKGEKEVNEELSIPVGRMEIKVGGLGNEVYYFYLLATIALLILLLWRRRKMM